MQQNLKEIEIKPEELPKIIKLVYNGNVIMEYVLMPTKDKQGIYLNKKVY